LKYWLQSVDTSQTGNSIFIIFTFEYLSRFDSQSMMPFVSCKRTSLGFYVFSFFDSFHAIQIYFNDLCSSTLCQFHFSNFLGVRSFGIFHLTYSDRFIETIEQLEKFVYPDICPYLQSLQLPIIHKHSLIGFLQAAFPHLRICHFYNSRYEKTVRLPTTTNTIPILRQLTIQEVTDKFDKIFLLCPNLVYFDFDRTRVFSSFIHLNSSYSSLKRLKIQRLKLHLTVDQCLLHDETLDFHKVAYYFRSSSSSNASTIQMFRQILQSSTCCFI
jgi:hypothetical protein